MAAPKIFVSDIQPKVRVLQSDGAHGWRLLAWLSVALLLAGLGDIAIALVPARFGVLEWEFATIASTFAGLPLVSMGAFGLLAASVALPSRPLAVATLVVLVLLVLGVGAGSVVFLTDVPIALASTPPEIALGIKRAIVKTLMLALVFGTAYLLAAVAAVRHLRSKRI